MKYMILEANNKNCTALDNQGRFFKAVNKGYEVGQRVDAIEEVVAKPAKPFSLKRIAAVAGSIAACLAIVFALNTANDVNNLPEHFGSVYLTINPEIRLDASKDGLVINLEALNDDAMVILDQHDGEIGDLTDVVIKLIDIAIITDLLADDGNITVNIVSENESWLEDFEDVFEQKIYQYFIGRIELSFNVQRDGTPQKIFATHDVPTNNEISNIINLEDNNENNVENLDDADVTDQPATQVSIVTPARGPEIPQVDREAIEAEGNLIEIEAPEVPLAQPEDIEKVEPEPELTPEEEMEPEQEPEKETPQTPTEPDRRPSGGGGGGGGTPIPPNIINAHSQQEHILLNGAIFKEITQIRTVRGDAHQGDRISTNHCFTLYYESIPVARIDFCRPGIDAEITMFEICDCRYAVIRLGWQANRFYGYAYLDEVGTFIIPSIKTPGQYQGNFVNNITGIWLYVTVNQYECECECGGNGPQPPPTAIDAHSQQTHVMRGQEVFKYIEQIHTAPGNAHQGQEITQNNRAWITYGTLIIGEVDFGTPSSDATVTLFEICECHDVEIIIGWQSGSFFAYVHLDGVGEYTIPRLNTPGQYSGNFTNNLNMIWVSGTVGQYECICAHERVLQPVSDYEYMYGHENNYSFEKNYNYDYKLEDDEEEDDYNVIEEKEYILSDEAVDTAFLESKDYKDES